MALSSVQQQQIVEQLRIGKLSNRAIAKEVGCSESAVRTLAKKKNVQKNAIEDLAKQEITNTIIQNEIKNAKNALTPTEKNAYDDVLIDLKAQHNLFNNDTITNQRCVRKAQDEIIKDINSKKNKTTAIDHLPNLMAIGKMTETNRKQLYGAAETYKPEKGQGNNEEDNKTELTLEEAKKKALELGVPLEALIDE